MARRARGKAKRYWEKDIADCSLGMNEKEINSLPWEHWVSSVPLKIYILSEKHLQTQICPKFLRVTVALSSLSFRQNLPVPKCRTVFHSFFIWAACICPLFEGKENELAGGLRSVASPNTACCNHRKLHHNTVTLKNQMPSILLRLDGFFFFFFFIFFF